MLQRGVSPRIVSAELLGSRGNTTVNGAELESRLGLPSTWAYFSIRSGASLTREPDLSGAAQRRSIAARAPAAHTAPARAATFDSVRGGVVAPAQPDEEHTQDTGGALAP